MSLAVKLLFSTMWMLAVAAIIGVATATVTTCGVGLVQGTGTWCGLHWTWLIGFPLAVIAAIIFGLPLEFLFRKWRITRWWQYGLTGFICAIPVWIQLAQPFTSFRWKHPGLYDSLNYLGSGVASGLAYWWICQKTSVINNGVERTQESGGPA